MGRGDLATLVRICDPAGRPRGTGFVADDRGTVVTSHEAVDGLVRVVLHAPGGRTCLAEADAVVLLPKAGLALVRTEGLGVRPLPISTRERVETGTYVRLAAHGWREARVLGAAQVTYIATDRLHLVGDAMELAIGTDGRDALRLGGEAVGGPVLDAMTGAVLGVLGTALQAGHRAAGFALPLRAPGFRSDGPLAELLRRNAATVPGYGHDLNLAGVLELTATSTGSAGGPSVWPDPVERPDSVREFASFTGLVMGLVGDPGTGRTTELSALAARRSRGTEPAPTVWLRGADLHADDTSVADAVARAIRQAGRILAASGARGDMELVTPDRVARLAREAGRPLLVLLDGPEEMPPVLAHRLPDWTAGTVSWLSSSGVRLVVGCRPEHWEQACALYPPEALHRPAVPAHRLPPALRIGDLSAGEAERARERYGLPAGAIAAADERHPLALRLLAEVREALPGEVPGRSDDAPGRLGDVPGRLGREDVFTAHLDLMCLRIAVRVAAASRPPLRGTAVRRLAARVTGQVHEAARRCLGPGQGELDRESFEEIFPWRTGWASAVLAEGLLVPAGEGYRFGHEELADWLQGAHLDLDAALHSLVHRWHARAPVSLPWRPGTNGPGAHVPPPPGSHERCLRALPVPRHRIGPVVQALLLLGREGGPPELARRLEELIDALDHLEPTRGECVGVVPADEVPGPGHACGCPRSPAAEAGGARPGGGVTGGLGGACSVREACEACGAAAGGWAEPGGALAGGHAPGCPWAPVSGAGAGSGATGGPAVPGTRAEPCDAPVGGAAPGPGGAPAGGPEPGCPWAAGSAAEAGAQKLDDAQWWGAHLLGEVLLRVPDAGTYLPTLRLLAERITQRSVREGGPQHLGSLGEFGPWFWERLRVTEEERIDLLRRLVPADGVPGGRTGRRYLDAVAARLTADPVVVQPLLCRWFTDGTPLPSGPNAGIRPTVAVAAQALLYACRGLAPDDLAEALVATAHPRADELLAVLVEEEPSVLCRTLDRWAHDPRPERRAAAAAYGLATAPRP
ncbi:trypsin-like peptidase domain-containing protein [Streptomyces sp. NPDC002730]|uniref:trypsin-like peptidase domain-containing protein n=1 Tax=Streptomyces sp. NPDC002730 TaxID=3364662 RepID=UPI0036CD9E86